MNSHWFAVALACISFALSLAITPAVRDLFRAMNLLDRPDGARKLHTRAVPRIGGIPLAISYVGSYAILLGWFGLNDESFRIGMPLIVRLTPAAGMILLTGLVDDLFGLRPWQKLAGQLIGSLWAVAAGVRIGSLAGIELDPPVAVVLSVAWMVGCTNAFNLIDGLDGLASGMGLFSTLTIFLAAVMEHDHTLALATLPLCGSLLGFLRYNFNPASVFLGDSGSLLIGFLLGCYGTIWSQKSATALGMTAPLMALAIPLLDAGLSILRRWLRGQPIFLPDRNHIHHRLLARGLTHRSVVLVLYTVAGVYAALSLLQSVTQHGGGLVLIVFCALTWIGIHHLGYLEFRLAGRFLFGGSMRKNLYGEIELHLLEDDLRRSEDEAECWGHIRARAEQFGFALTGASLNGREFAGDPVSGRDKGKWQIRVALRAGDFIQLSGSEASTQATFLGPLVEMLAQSLPARLDLIRRHRFEGPEPPPSLSILRLAAEVEAYETRRETAPESVRS